MSRQDLWERFREKAEATSTSVTEASDTREALQYVLHLCRKKEACQSLASGCDLPLSGAAADLCSLKEPEKVLAAPDLKEEELDILRPMCTEHNIALLSGGLRARLGGIDVGLTWAESAIAATGTLVQNCPGEDTRLAGMISEVHALLIPASNIVEQSRELAEALQQRMARGIDSTAFITGPSRTADIERVLTLGVHGPLEVHAVLLQDR